MTKVLVSFDDELLGRLDRAARDRGMTRSAYLAWLASRELQEEDKEARAKRIDEALDRLRTLYARHAQEDPRPSEEIFREMRDSR